MFSRKASFSSTGRAAAVAVAAALALTAVVPSAATAGSAPRGKGLTAATGDMTDISARRRGYNRGFNPGAAAAVAGVVGTGLAIAAASNRRAYYDDGYGYYGGGGPVYVAPAQGYYGGGYGPYYGSPYPRAGW